jgi:hypothetical protein
MGCEQDGGPINWWVKLFDAYLEQSLSTTDPDIVTPHDGTGHFVKMPNPPGSITITERKSAVYIHIGYVAVSKSSTKKRKLDIYSGYQFEASQTMVWIRKTETGQRISYRKGRSIKKTENCPHSDPIAVSLTAASQILAHCSPRKAVSASLWRLT